MSEMQELIQKYLNDKGKLDCSDGFKIAAKLKCTPLEVGECAKAMEIRIDGCELGQFGKLEGGVYDVEAENRLKPLLDAQNRVTCKAARSAAGHPLFDGSDAPVLPPHGQGCGEHSPR